MLKRFITNLSADNTVNQGIIERIAENALQHLRLFLIVVSVNLLFACTLHAALPTVTNSIFTISSNPSLSNISGTEILPQATIIYTGSNSYNINFDAPTSLDLTQTDPNPLTVSRTINPIWTWTFRTSSFTTSNPPTYTTSYTVSDFTNGTTTVPVTYAKTFITPTKSSNNWTLKEQLTLYFDFSKASRTGTYTGTIKVNVTGVNFQ